MMTGPNLEATRALAEAISIPVIASGGITVLDDVHALCTLSDSGVTAAITGRAIYEGTLDFREGQRVAGGCRSETAGTTYPANEAIVLKEDSDESWLDDIQWDDKGLAPAIAQETGSGKILMMAWMNRESLALTRETGHAVYWSRSRRKLWHKGEESGHQQVVRAIRLDCDADVILLEVEQRGGIACHTGRHNCFFRELRDGKWIEIAPVLKDPAAIYKKS
jgi:phosphoribosyl-AMP cyclohydrolase